jgi:hypothetical protein
MGMRKDLIVSEEEKQRKQKRLEENRNRTSNLQLTNASSTTQVLTNSEPLSNTLDDLGQVSFLLENLAYSRNLTERF